MSQTIPVKIACVVGTRPEVIKMAPVISALNQNKNFKTDIINTAQHRKLLDDMLKIFSLHPDVDLDLMQQNQSLATLSGNLFLKLGNILKKENYDLVLAQGDTTTTLISAQISFYNKIPFGHIEAGLRSNDINHPFPEEMNRVFISKIATLHFAPTEAEKNNLLKENIDSTKIIVTGNTVIDSLLWFANKKIKLPSEIDTHKRILLVTMHRRESFGHPLEDVFEAFIELATRFPDIEIIYPVHPNPNVNNLAKKMLSSISNIKLIDPLPYDQFVSLIKNSYLILTDSGGLQEEAPALNKPVLILRELTERPLITELGLGVLVGTNKNKIVTTASKLLNDEKFYQSMQKNVSPYGDGQASKRIVKAIEAYLSYGLIAS